MYSKINTFLLIANAGLAAGTNNWWIAHSSCTEKGATLGCKCKSSKHSLLSQGTLSFYGVGSHGWMTVFNSANGNTNATIIKATTNFSATERTNEVNWEGISSLEIVENSHWVTDGQPYDGASLESDGLTIDIEAGRKASEEVAGWFNADLRGINMAATEEGGVIISDRLPDELNFAVKFDITFHVDSDTTCFFSDFRVAQGSY